ncbi:hypothetical protein AAMO2058_001362800 [Amorphochlora amoebiformis]
MRFDVLFALVALAAAETVPRGQSIRDFSASKMSTKRAPGSFKSFSTPFGARSHKQALPDANRRDFLRLSGFAFLSLHRLNKAAKAAESNEKYYKNYSRKELEYFDGTDGKPIFIALKGVIFDVTAKAKFYGPGAIYGIFAGRDASRGLGKMSLEMVDVENPHTEDFTEKDMESLNKWVSRFETKYPVVGSLK